MLRVVAPETMLPPRHSATTAAIAARRGRIEATVVVIVASATIEAAAIATVVTVATATIAAASIVLAVVVVGASPAAVVAVVVAVVASDATPARITRRIVRARRYTTGTRVTRRDRWSSSVARRRRRPPVVRSIAVRGRSVDRVVLHSATAIAPLQAPPPSVARTSDARSVETERDRDLEHENR